MITYVNTVLVGKGAGVVADSKTLANKVTKAEAIDEAGKFVVESIDDSKFRVGLVTDKIVESYIKGQHKYSPIVKWSNDIKIADIKGMVITEFDNSKSAEDTVTIDFANVNAESLEGKRIVIRLTFKDLPTRYRKWTESYEYTVKSSDTSIDKIITGIKKELDRNFKRARIDSVPGKIVSDEFQSVSFNNDTKIYTGATCINLIALPYDDDESKDSISPANKVRFSANMWMTDPMASGFASKNKYSVDGAVINKTPGFQQVGEWKLVRDAEAQAMGYQGILNRGECTWPIIKPEMNVDPKMNYDTITLEFENMYRTADDLFRKTKQTVQIFEKAGSIDGIASAISAIIEGVGGNDDVIYNNSKETLA